MPAEPQRGLLLCVLLGLGCDVDDDGSDLNHPPLLLLLLCECAVYIDSTPAPPLRLPSSILDAARDADNDDDDEGKTKAPPPVALAAVIVVVVARAKTASFCKHPPPHRPPCRLLPPMFACEWLLLLLLLESAKGLLARQTCECVYKCVVSMAVGCECL